MRLYDYWRSSAAYRVRIALNFKGLAYEQVAVDLRAGAQRAPEFLALNPQGLVPVLEDDGAVLTQSLPILNYLEERYPERSLLPKDLPGRAARARHRGRDRLRDPPAQQPPRAAVPRARARRSTRPRGAPGITTGSPKASARSRRCSRAAPASSASATRPARRRLPRAAGLQRQALRLRPRALPDDPPDRRALPRDRGLRPRRPRAPARRGALTDHPCQRSAVTQ